MPQLSISMPARRAGRARRFSGRLVLLVALLTAFLAAAPAQATPVVALVKDIRPAAATDLGSNPDSFIESGGTIFFTASDRSNGGELWRTDGTADGTRLVKDIRPGPASSDPGGLTDVGGRLYFRADDGDGAQVWRSDGTTAGTFALTPPGTSYTWWFPYGFTPVREEVLFFAATSGLGYELWHTNGTAGGTRRLIAPFEAYRLTYAPLADHLYFGRDNQLWKSDSTRAGTTQVAELPGAIDQLVAAGGTLFFTVDNNGIGPASLWKSDGTAAGTAPVEEGASSWLLGPFGLTAAADGLYFTAYDDAHGYELWRSDGSDAGTRMVIDINPGPASAFSHYDPPPQFTPLGSLLAFVANDGAHGYELWVSDGSAAGTTQVIDLWPGSEGSRPYSLADLDGTLFFSADDGGGRGLWRSDGSQAGTAPVRDQGQPAGPYAISAIGGRLYFAADDQAHGHEPWVSDGSAAGTRMIKNIATDASANPDELTPFGDALYFTVENELGGRELWRSDGTEAGTNRLIDLDPGGRQIGVGEVAVSGGRLFFTSGEGDTYATRRSTLWQSDGTAAGTAPLVSFDSGDYFLSLSNLTDVNGTLFFISYAPSSLGFSLWRSDGTAGGTRQVASFMAGDDYIEVTSMRNVNGTLFFAIYDNEYGVMVWKSDGTAGGTRQIAFDGRWTDIQPLVSIGDTVYFATGESETSVLWKTTRASSSATRVKSLEGYLRQLTRAGDLLYFTLTTFDGPEGLWISDGTSRGTARQRGFNGAITQLAALRGRLLFSASDARQGRELYSSSGVDGGAFRLAIIAAGAEGSWPQEITPAYPAWRALFAATDGRSGLELWRTSGSRASTQPVADIAPGAGSSSPSSFVVVGEQTFFVADDNSTGRELWVMR